MIRELKGWHVLVMLLSFFGITIGVNTIFVYDALTTFSGEDVAQPYMKGLAWNQTLAARQAQAKQGWTASLSATRQKDQTVSVAFDVQDRNRNPVDGLDVSVTLRSPVNAHLDREVKLSPIGRGQYGATLPGVRQGQWDVIASVKPVGNAGFEAQRRIVLP
jgi:nitrogen fixation protein FixH